MRVEGEDPRWGTHSNTHDAQDVGVSPRSRNREGVDDGGAAVWGHPERAEPEDMGPDEMGL